VSAKALFVRNVAVIAVLFFLAMLGADIVFERDPVPMLERIGLAVFMGILSEASQLICLRHTK
jgi:hypothetical protein